MKRSVTTLIAVCAFTGALPLLAQDGAVRDQPTLAASDDRASVRAWIDLPNEQLELLGRFEAVVEVQADAGLRIENWSIDDALGDSVLLTVLDAQELSRAELGDWYARYEVMVEPLIDGTIEIGPLTLTYLIDPDPEADPTQLEPERVRLRSDALTVEVTGPGGGPPQSPAPAKAPIEADQTFPWRTVMIVGASIGVIGPIATALVLAVRTSARRDRDDAPELCLAELESLERVVRASDGQTVQVDGAAVAGEALSSVRAMFDRVFRLRTTAQSGPELLRDDRLRSVLSVDAYEHLRGLVERSESARFAGQTLEQQQAFELIDDARRIARAVRSQRGGSR